MYRPWRIMLGWSGRMGWGSTFKLRTRLHRRALQWLPGPQTFMKLTVFNSTGKKVALWFIANEFVRWAPPPICPPHVHQMSFTWSQAFPTVCCSFISVHYTERKLKIIKEKAGKAWQHLSREWRLVDLRWAYGGRGPHSNYVLAFIIECSNDCQDPRRSWDWRYSTPLVRKLLYGLLQMSL